MTARNHTIRAFYSTLVDQAPITHENIWYRIPVRDCDSHASVRTTIYRLAKNRGAEAEVSVVHGEMRFRLRPLSKPTDFPDMVLEQVSAPSKTRLNARGNRGSAGNRHDRAGGEQEESFEVGERPAPIIINDEPDDLYS